MSEEKNDHRASFQLIRGGRAGSEDQGAIQVVMASPEQQPFSVEAVIHEEDTYLVLSSEPRPEQTRPEHPIRMMTALLEVEPKPLGSIVVRPGLPLKILAVVHDLQREPSWKEEWVIAALAGALEEVERRELRSVALEMLGAVHGKLERPRFLQLLRRSLQQADAKSLERVWLIPPDRPTLESI